MEHMSIQNELKKSELISMTKLMYTNDEMMWAIEHVEEQ